MSTIRTEMLSKQEPALYRKEGRVTLGRVTPGRVMDDATLGAIRDEEACLRGDPAGQLTNFRSQRAHDSEPIRRHVMTGPHVALASQIIGSDDTAIWFNQFATKFPDAAAGKSEFPWHQDNGYVAIEPATHVTDWAALDDVEQRNARIWVMPRSCARGLLEHKTRSADLWHPTLDVHGGCVPATLKAGEAVAFSGLALHGSKLNHTDGPRCAFLMEYTDVQWTYQRPGQERRPVPSQSKPWGVRGRAA